jgi:endonuclease/exonuclease/phosphatase family metal-dependent hydrolase
MYRRIPPLAFAALLGGTACRSALNYPGPDGPRYVGGVDPVRPALAPLAGAPDSIRIVTFNIKFAEHVDRAAELLLSTPALHPADIIAVQEMDEPGVRALSAALGMSYVYYPATVHPQTGRDFGNAVLSRWPIIGDRKIVLPHLGRFEKTQRVAVGATILFGAIPVRVYSLHLGTQTEMGPGGRRDQVRAVLRDATPYPRVIVAGDMNSHGIGREFVAHGYGWPTQHEPATDHFWSWDHIFVLGLDDHPATGVVRDNHKASDHRPVWATIALRGDLPRSFTRSSATGP